MNIMQGRYKAQWQTCNNQQDGCCQLNLISQHHNKKNDKQQGTILQYQLVHRDQSIVESLKYNYYRRVYYIQYI